MGTITAMMITVCAESELLDVGSGQVQLPKELDSEFSLAGHTSVVITVLL